MLLTRRLGQVLYAIRSVARQLEESAVMYTCTVHVRVYIHFACLTVEFATIYCTISAREKPSSLSRQNQGLCTTVIFQPRLAQTPADLWLICISLASFAVAKQHGISRLGGSPFVI